MGKTVEGRGPKAEAENVERPASSVQSKSKKQPRAEGRGQKRKTSSVQRRASRAKAKSSRGPRVEGRSRKWEAGSGKLYFIVTIVLSLSCPGYARVGGYAWPMALNPALTSTFGEYRPGRLHAGIDLKTWGREGPIVAVDDGYVWRVRTSPWGYGRALYIRLKDGRTALYAHLSAFSPRIAALVQAEQERRTAYSVDLYLAPDRVPVKRGEVLGRSGSSGVGFPHLHFELRDGDQRPLNPLTNGFDVEDRVPPEILSVAFVPQDADARAAGRHGPYWFDVRWQPKAQRYRGRGQVAVEGRVGVAVEVYDRADASKLANPLAPYRLLLVVDGQEVFRTTYTAFGYDRVHQADLDRNFALSRRGAGRFHNLYLEDGNALSLYGAGREGAGMLCAGPAPDGQGVRLAPGPHRIEVVAEDASGNRAVAEVSVLAGAPPRVLDARAADAGRVRARAADADGDSLCVWFEGSADGGKTWAHLGAHQAAPGEEVAQAVPPGLYYRVRARDPYGLEGMQTCAHPPADEEAVPSLACSTAVFPDFAVIQIDSDRPLAAPPRAAARPPGGQDMPLEIIQRALRSYEAVLRFDPEAPGPVQVTVSYGQAAVRTVSLVQQPVRMSGGIVRSDDGAAEARFGPNCAYRTFFGRVEAEPAGEKPDLPAVGMAYRFAPDDVPFNGRAELRMRYPPGFNRTERLGIYAKVGEGRWAFLGNAVDAEGGFVAAGVRHFSTYALRVDEVPPVLSDLRPVPGTQAVDARPALSARLWDAGCGIGREEDISVRLDGQPLIFEYDPEAERLSATPRHPLSPGAHQLEVSVRDMCGNQARQTSEFTVR